MKNDFLNLFSISAGERKGIIVLILLIMILSGIRVFIVFNDKGHAAFEDDSFLQESGSSYENNEVAGDTSFHTGYESLPEFAESAELFQFDPNTVTAEELKRLGLNNKLLRTWINYRSHGAVFTTESDITKIFGMTPEVYEMLKPYIRIEKRVFWSQTVLTETSAKKTDINLSDSSDLIRLKGIGPVLSGRIVRYRKLLGGYCSTRQLLEVYGFNDSLLNIVNLSFYADTSNIRTLNINQATEETMRRHPYIGKFKSDGIIKYRKSVERIINLDELIFNGLFTREELEKVKSYLVI
jgi:competence protein ComEA